MNIPLNLKTRLTLWYLLATVLLVILFSTLAYFLLSQGLYGKTVHPWNMRIAQIEKTTDGIDKITAFSHIEQQNWGDQPSGPVKTTSSDIHSR